MTMLRDALAVAAIAVVVVQALRLWFGDRYAVPSDSMQPVLHGDPQDGDVVFVDKTARAAKRRRGDLVVVRHPEHHDQQLVKRIAACGDRADECFIDILDGDVWLGPDPQRMRREAKDPLVRAQRVPWAAWPEPAALLDVAAARVDGGELIVPPAGADAVAMRGSFTNGARQQRRREGRTVPAGFVGTARAVDASWFEVSGARGRSGDDVGVRDIGMDVEVTRVADELLCTIEHVAEALTFRWRPATGRVELWRNGEVMDHAEFAPLRGPGCRIEFGLLDDRAFFAVDGHSPWIVPRRAEWNTDRDAPGGGPRGHVHVAPFGERPLHARRLSVFHDVFAWRERIAGMSGDPGNWPREVPPGTWFLLGDNAFDSRDSRHFGPVPSASFIGKPALVLGPWPRCRWLP